MKLSTGVIHRVCATPKTTLNLASYLTASVRSILAGEPLMRIARRRSLVLLAVLCVVGTTPAEAVTDIDNLKLYAHSRLISYEQFQCLNKLITKESNWRINAVNGSHYGLGQMRNKNYRNLDGYRQIDWTIRYINGRYGSMCNAYRHWQKKGWH
tara:strand:- start:20 stop:481 length:462 start_codon:yes stop_codon:yes gene_type:complete